MTTAFVLSGGGSLGAVQVGMLRALAERRITPDLLVGTSAGALNAVFVAAHGTSPAALDLLAAMWAGAAPRRRLPAPGAADAARAGRSPGRRCAPTRAWTRLVRRHVSFARLEDAPIPVHLVATDLLRARRCCSPRATRSARSWPAAPIPAVLPPVRRDGRTLVDGGLADNAAISQAIALGADRVYVLPTGYACALPTPPTRPLAVAVQALSLLVQQRLITDVALYADRVDLVVLPPLCPLRVSAIDFRHAAELIRRAHASAASWLDSGAAARPRPGTDPGPARPPVEPGAAGGARGLPTGLT